MRAVEILFFRAKKIRSIVSLALASGKLKKDVLSSPLSIYLLLQSYIFFFIKHAD
jgi:hypothetical protein